MMLCGILCRCFHTQLVARKTALAALRDVLKPAHGGEEFFRHVRQINKRYFLGAWHFGDKPL